MRDMDNTAGRETAPAPMPHTRRSYTAPDHATAQARILRALTGVVPAPRVHSVDGADLVCDTPQGRGGAAVLNGRTATTVLAACGRALAKIHRVDTAAAFEDPPSTGILVHGDFRPERLLFAPHELRITGIVGWDHAHIGSAMEDLAWCEWSIRRRHPECFDAIPHLYYGYGIEVPPWRPRQAAMLAKCRHLGALAAQRKDGTAMTWQRHAAVTAAWRQ